MGVIMTQTYPYNSDRVLDRVMAAAYQAIDEKGQGWGSLPEAGPHARPGRGQCR